MQKFAFAFMTAFVATASLAPVASASTPDNQQERGWQRKQETALANTATCFSRKIVHKEQAGQVRVEDTRVCN